jgi:hypothetical protein
VLNYKVGDIVRIRSKKWIDAQYKDYDGSISLGERYSFSVHMFKYAGETARIAEVLSDSYLLELNDFEWKWQDWMFDPDYGRFKELLSIEDAIIAMVKDKETLYNKKGDLKYLWTGRSLISIDVATCTKTSFFGTLGDEFYRCPEKPKRAWTRWEVLDWINSEESRGWVVRKKGAKQWYSPQFFCYDDGADGYERARILPDKSGIDESTVQGLESEMKIEEAGK